MTFDDVAQELRLEVLKLAQRFDASKGASWRTFCGARLGWHIKDLLRAHGGTTRDGKPRTRAKPLGSLADASNEWSFDPRSDDDATSDVDWQDLRSRVESESRAVQAIWYHASGLTLAEVSKRLGVCESRVCQLLCERTTSYQAARARLKYLAFRE
jgi:DNA-directed RNA polymerase specialized sigma subunit